jgi:hypothetical protein
MRGQTKSQEDSVITMDSPALLPKIRSIRVLSRQRLHITWDDDKVSDVDMRDLITEGSAFAPLKDQDLFATARIGERRRTIEWPDPIDHNAILVDYCADSLRQKAEWQGVVQELQRALRAARNTLAHSAERVATAIRESRQRSSD